MPLLGAFVKALPNNIAVYDVQVDSFTVAAGATGNDFAVTGTEREYPVDPVKNAALGTNTQIFNGFAANISALCTTNSTDSYALEFQYSLDAGTSWTSFNPAIAWGGASAGVAHVNMDAAEALTDDYPFTDDKLMFRLNVNDLTSPTTDAFTITNIRATMFFTYLAT
jgi:hypothetical protein